MHDSIPPSPARLTLRFVTVAGLVLALGGGVVAVKLRQPASPDTSAPASGGPSSRADHGATVAVPVPPPGRVVKPELKIGKADMARIFQVSPRIPEIQERIKAARAKIDQETAARAKEVAAAEALLKQLRARIDDPTTPDAKRAVLIQQFERERQKGIALNEELQEFARRRERALQEQAKVWRREILKELQVQVNEVAAQEGYDFVFDPGATTTIFDTPLMVYSKDATDLTDLVLRHVAPEGRPGEAASRGGEK